MGSFFACLVQLIFSFVDKGPWPLSVSRKNHTMRGLLAGLMLKRSHIVRCLEIGIIYFLSLSLCLNI